MKRRDTLGGYRGSGSKGTMRPPAKLPSGAIKAKYSKLHILIIIKGNLNDV